MKNDLSFQLFEKYETLNNPIIELVLKNGEKLRGRFEGYFHGDSSKNEPYIVKWHFADEHEFSGIGLFDELVGCYIYQTEIKSVTFIEDGSTIIF